MTVKKRTKPSTEFSGRTPIGQSKTQLIEAFQPAYHKRLRRLCTDAPALEDLAETFPALLFALATGHGTKRARTTVRAMILRGAPLRRCAKALGLPWWTRRLPAGSFRQAIGKLPAGPATSSQGAAHKGSAYRAIDSHMAQLVPASADLADNWLQRVTYANEAHGAGFALWIAKYGKADTPLRSSETFVFLTAWAWFADQTETRGHGLLRKSWSPSMGLRRAVDEMTHWRRRIALLTRLGDGVTDRWIEEGSALGFDFVALRSVEEFIAESDAMDNCLDHYDEYLESDATRIFSVRKNGKPVADVEIGPHPSEARMPALVQLRGRRNRRASAELWRATYAWLGNTPLKFLPSETARLSSAAQRRNARKDFWQPYLDSLQGSGHAGRFKLLALGGAKRDASSSRRDFGNGRTAEELARFARLLAAETP